MDMNMHDLDDFRGRSISQATVSFKGWRERVNIRQYLFQETEHYDGREISVAGCNNACRNMASDRCEFHPR